MLDVVQLPAFGKKGRLATQIQVLARPETLDAVIDRCFAETTTIGLRWRIEARAVLAREVVSVAGPDREVAVKVVTRPDGGRTAKAEIDQVAGDGHAARAGQTAGAPRPGRWRPGGMVSEIRNKAAELDAVLAGIGAVAVAVSGGVDSMTLAVAAGRRLGARAGDDPRRIARGAAGGERARAGLRRA